MPVNGQAALPGRVAVKARQWIAVRPTRCGVRNTEAIKPQVAAKETREIGYPTTTVPGFRWLTPSGTFVSMMSARRRLHESGCFSSSRLDSIDPNDAGRWLQTRSLRTSCADWCGRYGRSMESARHATQPLCRDQVFPGTVFRAFRA